MPPTVMSPPSPFHLNANKRPIIVLTGKRRNATISDFFKMTVFASVLKSSAMVINNKKIITTKPSSFADHKISVNPFPVVLFTISSLSCSY